MCACVCLLARAGDCVCVRTWEELFDGWAMLLLTVMEHRYVCFVNGAVWTANCENVFLPVELVCNAAEVFIIMCINTTMR